jgi:hypothetical protein
MRFLGWAILLLKCCSNSDVNATGQPDIQHQTCNDCVLQTRLSDYNEGGTRRCRGKTVISEPRDRLLSVDFLCL